MSRLFRPFFVCLSLAFTWLSCESDKTLFKKLKSSTTGIRFKNELTESADFNVLKYGYFYNGGGVAAADFTNDGLVDLYFTGNLSSNKLYINTGDLTFEDRTEAAQVGAADGWNTGVSVVDINADGWLDVYVCRSAAETANLRKNKLFINHGPKKPFTEEAEKYGLADPGYSTQAVFFDYDHDNDLDMFLLNHSVQQYAGFSRLLGQMKTQENELYGSKLFRNDTQAGVPKFTEVTKEAGILSNVLTFGLGVVATDVNNDSWLDLYVSNDYNEEDYLYINQRNGTFRESVREAMPYVSLFSMGCDAADYTNDGWTDIMTLDMQPTGNERIKMTSGDDNFDKYTMLTANGFHHQAMRNMLHRNNADGTFTEVGQLAGVSNTDWSWATLFADFNLDGWKDLFISNGYARDYTNMDFLKFSAELQQSGQRLETMQIIEKMPQINEANFIFENTQNGLFTNRQQAWGLDEKSLSNGAAVADLDNDGDLDLIINTINAEAALYENTIRTEKKRSVESIRVELKGNDAAKIGAKVGVFKDGSQQWQEFSPVRGFQSSSYGHLYFGGSYAADSIRVIWADGRSEVASGRVTGKVFTYSPTLPVYTWPSRKDSSSAAIRSISAKGLATNEFKVQPLLPFMLKTLGERLAVSSGNSQLAWVASDDSTGSDLMLLGTPTKTLQHIPLPKPGVRPAAARLADLDGDKLEDLAIAYFSYGISATNGLLVTYKGIGGGKVAEGKRWESAGNPLALEVLDVNQDGLPDIVCGGFALPNQYPNSSPTIIWQNTGNQQFKAMPLVTDKPIRLVSSLARTESKTGGQQLLVATHFGPIYQLSFIKGKALAKEISATGCWFNIKVADINADGRADILAGNLGLNNQWAATSPDGGLLMTAIEDPNRGQPVPVVGIKENAKVYPFAGRDEILDQLPKLKNTYISYSLYAKATLNDISDLLKAYPQTTYSADELRSGAFLQSADGNSFVFKPFPLESQQAPVVTLAAGGGSYFVGGNIVPSRVRVGQLLGNRGQLLTWRNPQGFASRTIGQLNDEIRGAAYLNNTWWVVSTSYSGKK